MAVRKLFGLGFLPPKILRGEEGEEECFFSRDAVELGGGRRTPVVFQGWRACYVYTSDSLLFSKFDTQDKDVPCKFYALLCWICFLAAYLANWLFVWVEFFLSWLQMVPPGFLNNFTGIIMKNEEYSLCYLILPP